MTPTDRPSPAPTDAARAATTTSAPGKESTVPRDSQTPPSDTAQRPVPKDMSPALTSRGAATCPQGHFFANPHPRPRPPAPPRPPRWPGAAAVRPAAPPPYRLLRADEDYRYLRDPAPGRPPGCPQVHPARPAQAASRSASAARPASASTAFRHLDWGAGPPRSLSWLQRYMLHAELRAAVLPRASPRSRAPSRPAAPAARGTSTATTSTSTRPSPTSTSSAPACAIILRAGRHELAFGSGRLVSPREGPNVRRSFDGVSLIVAVRRVRAHLFVTRPVATPPRRVRRRLGARSVVRRRPRHGALAVARRPGRRLRALPRPPRRRVPARAGARAPPVSRDTLVRRRRPARLQRRGGAAEPASSATPRCSAWTLASDTGIALPLPWDPRLGVRLDVASGDRGGRTAHGHLLRAVPQGLVLRRGRADRPRQLLRRPPHVDARPARAPRASPSTGCACGATAGPTASTTSPASRSSTTSVTRGFIGHRAGATLEAELGRHIGFVVTVGRFFRGPFLRPGRAHPRRRLRRHLA